MGVKQKVSHVPSEALWRRVGGNSSRDLPNAVPGSVNVLGPAVESETLYSKGGSFLGDPQNTKCVLMYGYYEFNNECERRKGEEAFV